jgi:hypothetical protein
MAASNGWQTAHRAEDEEALLVAGVKVKARFNPARQELLWLNLRLADGGWTYYVVDRSSGELVVQATDVIKKRCWEKAVALLRERDAAATTTR